MELLKYTFLIKILCTSGSFSVKNSSEFPIVQSVLKRKVNVQTSVNL